LRRDRLEIGRALVEINAANWQSLLPYYTDDYEYHDPIVDIYGFDTLVPFFARLFASSPDLVTTVEDEMLIGGVYTATWTMVGQFNGVPYSAKGMSILKFRDLEHTDVLLAGLLQRVRRHGDHPRARPGGRGIPDLLQVCRGPGLRLSPPAVMYFSWRS
jgi:predicted SnoaL-like aldol condensation-catalyzing enzyme